MDAVTLAAANAAAAKRFAVKSIKTVLPLGDSITYLDVGFLSEAPNSLRAPATAYQVDGAKNTGMWAWANALMGHPLRFTGNAGVPGDTSEDMLNRLTAALAIPCDAVSVLAGANDFTAGWAASRTIAALTTIYGRILASGRRLIVFTTMSRSTMNTTAGHLYLATVNRWIADYARATPGVIFIDICSVLTDPATGVPYNNGTPFNTADGTHPNAYGALQLGQRIATAMRPWITPSHIFSTVGATDPLNYMRNPANTGTGGTVANGITGTPGNLWAIGSISGTAVAAVSKVARTDGEQGEWTRIVIGPANTVGIAASGSVWWQTTDGGGNVTQAGFKVGDKVLCAIEVRTTALAGVSLFNGGIYHPNSQALDLSGSWNNGTGTLPDGTYILLVEGVTIGAAATYVQARVGVQATSGTLDIGRCAAYKVG